MTSSSPRSEASRLTGDSVRARLGVRDQVPSSHARLRLELRELPVLFEECRVLVPYLPVFSAAPRSDDHPRIRCVLRGEQLARDPTGMAVRRLEAFPNGCVPVLLPSR